MGNSFCQCNSLFFEKKEENLSSSNLSKTYNYNNKNSRNKININSLSTIRTSETIRSIYRKNCAEKIIKTYLKYKKNKNENLNNNIGYINTKHNINKKEDNKYKIFSRNDKEPINNTEQYSIDNPFYIDKVHKSKTIYEKFYIPKINNGKSLEMLNRNSSEHYLSQDNNE